MSLRSTFTNASINGWVAKSGRYTQRQKIPDPNEAGTAFFQLAMSGDGNTIVARTHTISGLFATAIYIYTKDSNAQWQYVDTLYPPYISYWVDISYDGLTFITGFADPSGAGRAHIYVNSGGTWSLQSTLLPSDTPQPYFGVGVSISGDGNNVIIGCPREGATNYGSAYIFTRSGSTWTEQQKIIASDQLTNDYFGTNVSINNDGTKVAVGAPQGGLLASTTYGKAYVFTRSGSTWTQQQKLTAPTLATLRNFGQRIKISNDGFTVIVAGTGATDAQTSITYGGQNVYAFYYNGSTWTNTQRITLLDYGFGSDICMNNNGSILLIGAGTRISPYSDNNNNGGPMANPDNTLYIYGGNNGVYSLLQSITITPSNGETNIGMYVACDAGGSSFMTDSMDHPNSATSYTNMYYYTLT